MVLLPIPVDCHSRVRFRLAKKIRASNQNIQDSHLASKLDFNQKITFHQRKDRIQRAYYGKFQHFLIIYVHMLCLKFTYYFVIKLSVLYIKMNEKS